MRLAEALLLPYLYILRRITNMKAYLVPTSAGLYSSRRVTKRKEPSAPSSIANDRYPVGGLLAYSARVIRGISLKRASRAH